MPTAPSPKNPSYSNKLPSNPAPASLWKGEGPIVKSGATGDSQPEDIGTATDKG